ncbi:MAG: saccharopine dehydrogenase C-terminal domain-containing protein [Flavobacteriales bacterium]|nr:saccharopine dehydrogenase C-terminal domain-containing protein [Flavobacteriales bacterium]
MKNILVIGAGRSAVTLIEYLLNESIVFNWKVTIADYNIELAKEASLNHKNSRVILFNINNSHQRENEIKEADIVVSMLPASMHSIVANDCVKFRKNLVTASYVSDEIKELDNIAREHNIILLNEIGLDPGIDHMSAMKVIDDLKNQEAHLKSFKSYCGGLIHPDFDNNPWNYKFTWNPRNVILAGQGVSKYLEEKKVKEIEYKDLFNQTEIISILDQGDFEAYTNRDSLSYITSYGLDNIDTMYRGTLRKKGFSKSWNYFIKLGLTKDDYVIENSASLTYKEFINLFVPKNDTLSLEERFCDFLSIDIASEEFCKFNWLEIFSDKLTGIKDATPAQILQKIMEEKLSLDNEDKDMIVMQHQFEYVLNNKACKLNSSLAVFGDDQRNTAMAKTVGLPVAIAVKLILNDVIKAKGVQIPTSKEIYLPVLDELSKNGIDFIEELV